MFPVLWIRFNIIHNLLMNGFITDDMFVIIALPNLNIFKSIDLMNGFGDGRFE